MAKTAHRLAAAASDAWKANGASKAMAAATMQINANAANKTDKPASPWVIDFAVSNRFMPGASSRKWHSE
jgi:hypothetical protein